MTEAPAGTLLWSHTAQVAFNDVFRVQDELARRIVESLALPLSSREQRMLRSDVPGSTKAYELFLRGNQLSVDAKQWSVARDLYERSVADDPGYAPAWARLGRMRHVMAKYLEAGPDAATGGAEEAFRRALELNPDLPVAHKLYAQFEVDQGRARDAMVRLAGRARSADPELFPGLVTTCRYCGLLDASLAAEAQARRLEPAIKTSVTHTWFVKGDYDRVVRSRFQENPYIISLSMDALGRKQEAIDTLREHEKTTWTRLRDFMVIARTLLEGKVDESLAAVNRILASGFRDPEALFYLTRHLSHLEQTDQALDLFERLVAGGYFCHPMMARDPWLDPLRRKPAFRKLLGRAEQQHQEAVTAFEKVGGGAFLPIV